MDRLRRVKDFHELVSLNAKCFPRDQAPDWDACAWWAAGDPVVGFAGCRVLTSDSEVLLLERAGVHPTARGRHLQARLIRVRLSWGRRQGCRVAITYVLTQNHASMNNLIRCGFQVYRPEFPWVGHRDVLYWRRTL